MFLSEISEALWDVSVIFPTEQHQLLGSTASARDSETASDHNDEAFGTILSELEILITGLHL